MARIFNISVGRAIRESLGRFLAILLIVALGCGFYAGLRMTGPDMRTAADAWYDGTHLYDVEVLSTLGLSQQQVEEIGAVPGVEAVMPAKSVDVMTSLNGSQYVMRVHSLDIDAAQKSEAIADNTVQSDDDCYLNRLVLDSGKWPERAGEAILSADRVMNTTVSLGDTVTVEYGSTDLEDVLESREYTVVGLAHSSLYTSDANMGTTSLGSGKIQQYMYVADANFDVQDMEDLWRAPDGQNCCVNQILYNLGSRGVEYDLVPWQRERGVPFMAYCPVGQAGALVTQDRVSKEMMVRDPNVRAVAERHGCSIVQVLLAFVLRLEDFAAMPKAVSFNHIEENYAVRQISLTEEDIEQLSRSFPSPKEKIPMEKY